tara:strand:- start:814 stop:1482 length:669 start_codon:yes stop_codon:yes gene_type:complete
METIAQPYENTRSKANEPSPTTNEQLRTMRQQISDEPEHFDRHSMSSEEDTDDSDNEMVLKFNKPKKRKQTSDMSQLDTVSLAFSQSKKIGNLKADLSKTEERLRYLQLDHNTRGIKIDELEKKLTQFRVAMTSKKELVLSQEKQIKILKIHRFGITLFFGLCLLQTWFDINSLFFLKEILKMIIIAAFTAGNFFWGFIGQGFFKSQVLKKIQDEFDTLIKM